MSAEALKQRLKVRRARDEVRLAVHADEVRALTVRVNAREDATFAGRSARLLVRRLEALLAQEVDRCFEVPAGLLEGLFAVHHRGPGLVPKLLHLAC